eukprot:200557-Prorocentrum_minimum.AAC.1
MIGFTNEGFDGVMSTSKVDRRCRLNTCRCRFPSRVQHIYSSTYACVLLVTPAHVVAVSRHVVHHRVGIHAHPSTAALFNGGAQLTPCAHAALQAVRDGLIHKVPGAIRTRISTVSVSVPVQYQYQYQYSISTVSVSVQYQHSISISTVSVQYSIHTVSVQYQYQYQYSISTVQ